MRWEDERYVRVFTRDTAEWIALGWEAQSLFMAILRKVDRAGILTLGKTGARGLAGVVRFPVEVVERALPILLEDECIKQGEGALVVPNFIVAQEAPQSDKARQREKRERDRSRVMGEAGITNRDNESQNVTDSHAVVTPRHAASLLAVPCRAEPDRGSARDGEPVSDPGPDLIAFAAELAAEESKQAKKGIGSSVAERVASGGLPTQGQRATLRKIYDSRVSRTGAIPLSADEQWSSERWREARRRLKLPDGEPERRHIVALWEKAAKASAETQAVNGWKPTAREIVAHWIKSYLSDGQSHAGGIVDQKHPIALLVARAGETYGLPPKPQRKPSASPPPPAEPPPARLPPSAEIMALASETMEKMRSAAPVKRPRST